MYSHLSQNARVYHDSGSNLSELMCEQGATTTKVLKLSLPFTTNLDENGHERKDNMVYFIIKSISLKDFRLLRFITICVKNNEALVV